MARLYAEVVGQSEDLRMNCVVQFARIALLEVRPPAAANEQRIASEHQSVRVFDERPIRQSS